MKKLFEKKEMDKKSCDYINDVMSEIKFIKEENCRDHKNLKDEGAELIREYVEGKILRGNYIRWNSPKKSLYKIKDDLYCVECNVADYECGEVYNTREYFGKEITDEEYQISNFCRNLEYDFKIEDILVYCSASFDILDKEIKLHWGDIKGDFFDKYKALKKGFCNKKCDKIYCCINNCK